MPYRPDQISDSKRLRLGPQFAALAPLAGELTVVNGLLVRTANHYTGIEQAARLQTMTTMRTPGILDIVGSHRDSQPLARVSLNSVMRQAQTLNYFGTSTPLDFGGGEDVFERIERLKPQQLADLAGVVERQIRAIRRRGRVSARDGEIASALGQTGALFRRLIDCPKHAAAPWFSGELGARDEEAMFGAHLQRALWLIENDLSATVTIYLTDLGWDTHSDNLVEQTALNRLLAASLVRLVSELKTRRNRHGLLSEQTAVVVASEIGRYPYLNRERGKDHFPQVPVALWGRWFRPGGFGATGKQLEALAVSPERGTHDPRGQRLVLDDLGTTVLHIAGLVPERYGVAGRELRFVRATPT